MAFQKAPDNTARTSNEQMAPAEVRQNILSTLNAVKFIPGLNRHSNQYDFDKLYAAQGKNLAKMYEERAITQKRDKIVDNFFNNRHAKFGTELSEALPLYANAPGRLGDYIEATITKTARPDDQGGSFVDLVIEIKNKWLAEKDAPKEAREMVPKMTFLVDITTASGESMDNKMKSMRMAFLFPGEEAEVLCYQDSFGKLGIKRPKVLVAKTQQHMELIGAKLGKFIAQRAADSYVINNPEKFDEAYREYFLDFMRAIRENAQRNILFMENLPPDPKRQKLIAEYRKIVLFIDMYEKTPLTRPRAM